MGGAGGQQLVGFGIVDFIAGGTLHLVEGQLQGGGGLFDGFQSGYLPYGYAVVRVRVGFLCPLGVQHSVLGNGCVCAKWLGKGFIGVPTGKGVALFGGGWQIAQLAAAYHILGLHRAAAVGVKGNGVGGYSASASATRGRFFFFDGGFDIVIVTCNFASIC